MKLHVEANSHRFRVELKSQWTLYRYLLRNVTRTGSPRLLAGTSISCL